MSLKLNSSGGGSVTLDAPVTASNYTVTVPASNGTLATTDGANTTFTSITDSGNLTFTGTGNRITGDFSNATVANRVAFQTSTANGATTIMALPNGSGSNAQLLLRSSSTAVDDSFGQIVLVGGIDFRLSSGQSGTGTYLPMTLFTGGSERMRIDTSGNVGIGTSSPLERLHVVGGPVLVGGTLSALRASTVSLDFSGGTGRVIAIGADASSVAPIVFGNATTTNFAERMRIDSSGNLLVGTTTASQKLTVNGGATATYFTGSINGSTNVTTGGGNTVIANGDGMFFVSGDIASNNFKDVLVCQSYGNVTVFGSAVFGNPSARTYSMSAGNLQLSLSGGTSGTYSVKYTRIVN